MNIEVREVIMPISHFIKKGTEIEVIKIDGVKLSTTEEENILEKSIKEN